jgi:hypothetical protein
MSKKTLGLLLAISILACAVLFISCIPEDSEAIGGQTMNSTFSPGATMNATEGQTRTAAQSPLNDIDEPLKEVDDYSDWNIIQKRPNIQDDMEVHFINIGESVDVGGYKYKLWATQVRDGLYQLMLSQDGYDHEIGSPRMFEGAYAAIVDLNGDGKLDDVIIEAQHMDIDAPLTSDTYVWDGTFGFVRSCLEKYPVDIEEGYITLKMFFDNIISAKCVTMRYAYSNEMMVQSSMFFDIVVEDGCAPKYHTVIKDFEAFMLKDAGTGSYSPITLKAGTKLQVISTNLIDRINFKTEGGLEGYFNYSFFTWDRLINGVPQEEIFDSYELSWPG